MESQPTPNGVFISFTQPGVHITQPGQAVASNSSNQPNGTLQKFLKGEPKVLGAFQILIALVTLICGIVMLTSIYIPYVGFSGYSICGSIFFIVSGSLSVAAEKKPTKSLGLFSIELILTILEFCITMSLSIYGCKAVCDDSNQIVIYLTANSQGPGLTTQESDYERLTSHPPNYEDLTSKK
ncbi:membrane-spanning 4-domains subfamily A member 4D-like isoform X2 [Ornithorhynchus anatinus]|uniref:membrane-spanning 4-domains subfamily A member 4D-like isoform X2 n=1 Tax=Ornithorhynchus anatinus TaxID=9258 RepID=UPI0010A82015|nr:membrane-spanning 4-domains subfamily A member 4D-like isoform X2 [Ornithorhynchus anatinus]